MRGSAGLPLRILAFAACLLAGCAGLSEGVDPARQARMFAHPDGGQALFYELDVGGWGADPDPDTYLFVVPGSDCGSMGRWLPAYFEGLGEGAGAFRIFILHKRHIEDGATSARCGESFTRADHPRQWLADQAAFIASRRPAPPRRLVLVGISEGGEIVPALARHIGGVTHVILIASGAMDPLEALALQALRHGIEGADAVVAAANGPPPPDPDAPSESLGGRSWRYWSELRDLHPADDLLRLDIPILVAMGGNDRSMPVEAALSLASRFEAAGKPNLTVRIYPQADHALFDAGEGRSRLPEFWREARRWLSPR